MSYNATAAAILAVDVADVRAGLDVLWVLVCAVLVLLMQAGFSMLEAGSVRANNTKSLVLKNFADLVIGSIFYGIMGYALSFGSSQTVVGENGWLWTTVKDNNAFFFFQLAFACTAATIDSGSVAERIDMTSYLILSALVCAVIYPIPCHWVWGGGFLAEWGFKDFAGGMVVHAVGGFCGLVGSVMLGPRIGRFNKHGEAKDIPGHSIVLQALGTWLLFVGWFGFNCGSTLQMTDGAWKDAAHVANTTITAGLVGGLLGLITFNNIFGRYNVSAGFNSLLAGLVAITPAAPFVSIGASMFIGGLAGVLYCFVSSMMVHRFKVDDPLDAFTVHGVSGVMGTFMIGLLDRDDGLLYGGGFRLLGIQMAGICIICVWAAGTMFAAHWAVHKIRGTTRVTSDVELAGCDSELLGGPAYITIEKEAGKMNDRHLLEDLLVDHEASRCFRDFLQGKDSEELINFFYAVMDFQAMYHRDKNANKPRSDHIFATYVQEGAPCRVNVPGWVYKDLLIRRNFPTQTMYQDALSEVLTSMRELCDSYFAASNEFKRYVSYKESLLPKPLLYRLSRCCCFGQTAADKLAVERDAEIEKGLLRSRFEAVWTGRILLLGAGESGKSTFLKQVKQQYDTGADVQAFRATIRAIRTNVVECMQTLLTQESIWAQQESVVGKTGKHNRIMSMVEEVEETTMDHNAFSVENSELRNSRFSLSQEQEQQRKRRLVEEELDSELNELNDLVKAAVRDDDTDTNDNNPKVAIDLENGEGGGEEVRNVSATRYYGLNTLPAIDPVLRHNVMAMVARAGSYSIQDCKMMQKLWKHPRIQMVYAHRDEFWLIEACAYYMEHMERFLDTPGKPYSPTEQDVLYARVKTVGVSEVILSERTLNSVQKVLSYVAGFKSFARAREELKFPTVQKLEHTMNSFANANLNSMLWKVVDVGGQRSERRKWVAYLDNVDAVCFMVNSNGYRSPLYEDPSLRKSDESLALIEETFQFGFSEHPITLLLSKTDLFHAEFDRDAFSEAYPDWHAPDGLSNQALPAPALGGVPRLQEHRSSANNSKQNSTSMVRDSISQSKPSINNNETREDSKTKKPKGATSLSEHALAYLADLLKSKIGGDAARVTVCCTSLFDQDKLFDVFQDCKDEVVYRKHGVMWEYLEANQMAASIRAQQRRGSKKGGKYQVQPHSTMLSTTNRSSKNHSYQSIASGYDECGPGFVNKEFLAASLRTRR